MHELHPHDESHAYRFCPRCAHALERRRLKKSEPERLVCPLCSFVFYVDPKIAVGTIIRTATSRLVLLKRAIEPGYGKWVFPGGYVDRGEPLTMAAIREAREESGLEIRLDSLVNIYSYAGRAPVIVVYAATALSGALTPDDESLEVAEVEDAAIPWDQLAFRSTGEALHDYLAGRLLPLSL
jgi:ADP-ribose pyrophosphatase YjhB (NUDIX family)